MTTRGKFITLEGIDGAGKTSHVGAIVALIEARGHKVYVTREPGGTELGEKLRVLLLAQKMHLDTEALLMFAARAEHVRTVIEPALATGIWVVSDRFTDATFAYQGGGRGLEWERIGVLENWVQRGLQPDLTLFFDLPSEVGMGRRKQASLELDRFEQENRAFFERVRAGYLRRAAEHPERVRVIDATPSLSEVGKSVEEVLLNICL